MIRTTTINMRGRQHIICVKKDKLPKNQTVFAIRIDDQKRQIVMFGAPLSGIVNAWYKLANVKGSYRIGLSPLFVRNNGLKAQDKVRVDYRKDRLVITGGDTCK